MSGGAMSALGLTEVTLLQLSAICRRGVVPATLVPVLTETPHPVRGYS